MYTCRVLLLILSVLVSSCALTRVQCIDGKAKVEHYTFVRVADATAVCTGEVETVKAEHKKMSVTLGQAVGLVIDGVIAYFTGKAV